MSFPEPYFVTPHAMRRFRERVDPAATDAEVVREVQAGVQGVTPSYPPDRTIALGDAHRRFIAIVEPPLPGMEWPSVVTVWGWKLCPILLRKKGGPTNGWRRYRWLNGAFVGGHGS